MALHRPHAQAAHARRGSIPRQTAGHELQSALAGEGVRLYDVGDGRRASESAGNKFSVEDFDPLVIDDDVDGDVDGDCSECRHNKRLQH